MTAQIPNPKRTADPYTVACPSCDWQGASRDYATHWVESHKAAEPTRPVVTQAERLNVLGGVAAPATGQRW